MLGLEHSGDHDLKSLIRRQISHKSIETAGVAQAKLSDILIMIKSFREADRIRLAKDNRWKFIQDRINKYGAKRAYSLGFYSQGEKLIRKVVIDADFARVARLTLRSALARLQLEDMKRKREVLERKGFQNDIVPDE